MRKATLLCRHDRTLFEGCQECLGPDDWRLADEMEASSVETKRGVLGPSVNISVPDDLWEPNDGLDDPLNALRVTLHVNGYPMHFEAWEVHEDEDGHQHAVAPEYEENIDALWSAVSGDGRFQTTRINGREYILVASPFC